jgi:hypothetical protein
LARVRAPDPVAEAPDLAVGQRAVGAIPLYLFLFVISFLLPVLFNRWRVIIKLR